MNEGNAAVTPFASALTPESIRERVARFRLGGLEHLGIGHARANERDALGYQAAAYVPFLVVSDDLVDRLRDCPLWAKPAGRVSQAPLCRAAERVCAENSIR